jgi:hypothetical protein
LQPSSLLLTSTGSQNYNFYARQRMDSELFRKECRGARKSKLLSLWTNETKMKNICKIGLLVIIVLSMNFCVPNINFFELYRNGMNSWKGQDVNYLISIWGPPSDVYTMPNGNKMYSWLKISGTVITTNYNYYLSQTRSNVVTKWCKTTFTVNTSDIIKAWMSEGNDCY